MSGSGSSSSSMQRKYRGVRPRKWGKWVTEVREPRTKRRVWLGSFRSAEEAARAYDAGLLCVGGSTSKLNFPNERPELPPGTPGNYTTREVQGAAQMAAAASVGRRFSFPNWMRSQSPTRDSDTEEDTAPPDLDDTTPPDLDDTNPDPLNTPYLPSIPSSPYPYVPNSPDVSSSDSLWPWRS